MAFFVVRTLLFNAGGSEGTEDAEGLVEGLWIYGVIF